jgi:hypothetical protein
MSIVLPSREANAKWLYGRPLRIQTKRHVRGYEQPVTDKPFLNRVLQVRIWPRHRQGPVDQQLSPFSTRWANARWSCQDSPGRGDDPSVTTQALRRSCPLIPTAVALST